jgi:metal-sulfur cluster biosynthetic enzyme
MVTEEQVREALRDVYDPEVSISVQDLGLIYEVNINEEEAIVEVVHTLTSMMCPFADEICEDIYTTVAQLPGVKKVEPNLVFEPPFGIDKVPEETRMLMGWY